jgi:polar amino acid transport system substrate-binding protein
MTRFSTVTTKILLLLSVLTFSTSLLAIEKISIAVGEWPPYISQDQKHNGVISHLITDIFQEIGIEASIHFLPWSRAYDDAAKGRFSATAVWMHKSEREDDFIYSDIVLTEQFVFFHKKSLQFNWDSLKDLKDINIGGVIASSYGPLFDKALVQGELVMNRVSRPQQNFKMLLHNRIDVFPFEINVGNAVLKDHLTSDEQKEITSHPKPYLNNSSFLLFPRTLRNSQNLSIRFNKQLETIKADGRYDLYFEHLKQGLYKKDG